MCRYWDITLSFSSRLVLAIIARIFARRATMTRLRTDDYLMIIAGVNLAIS
jgi:hypothetical protein